MYDLLNNLILWKHTTNGKEESFTSSTSTTTYTSYSSFLANPTIELIFPQNMAKYEDKNICLPQRDLAIYRNRNQIQSPTFPSNPPTVKKSSNQTDEPNKKRMLEESFESIRSEKQAYKKKRKIEESNLIVDEPVMKKHTQYQRIKSPIMPSEYYTKVKDSALIKDECFDEKAMDNEIEIQKWIEKCVCEDPCCSDEEEN